MNYKALAPLALAAVIAFAQPVAFIAQEAGKAADILAAARKAIGDRKLDALKTFSVQSALQRNVADDAAQLRRRDPARAAGQDLASEASSRRPRRW